MCYERLFKAGVVVNLHGVIEFIPVKRYAASLGQNSPIKHDNHECLVRNSLPLTEEPILRRKLEAKAWIVIAISYDIDEW